MVVIATWLFSTSMLTIDTYNCGKASSRPVGTGVGEC